MCMTSLSYGNLFHEASLLLVNGNPLQDVTATGHVSVVIYKGQRLDRSELLDQQ